MNVTYYLHQLRLHSQSLFEGKIFSPDTKYVHVTQDNKEQTITTETVITQVRYDSILDSVT